MADRCGWACLVCLVKMSSSHFHLFLGFLTQKKDTVYIFRPCLPFLAAKFEFNVTACLKVKFLFFGHLCWFC